MFPFRRKTSKHGYDLAGYYVRLLSNFNQVLFTVSRLRCRGNAKSLRKNLRLYPYSENVISMLKRLYTYKMYNVTQSNVIQGSIICYNCDAYLSFLVNIYGPKREWYDILHFWHAHSKNKIQSSSKPWGSIKIQRTTLILMHVTGEQSIQNWTFLAFLRTHDFRNFATHPRPKKQKLFRTSPLRRSFSIRKLENKKWLSNTTSLIWYIALNPNHVRAVRCTFPLALILYSALKTKGSLDRTE